MDESLDALQDIRAQRDDSSDPISAMTAMMAKSRSRRSHAMDNYSWLRERVCVGRRVR